jgi:hypothetical protein
VLNVFNSKSSGDEVLAGRYSCKYSREKLSRKPIQTVITTLPKFPPTSLRPNGTEEKAERDVDKEIGQQVTERDMASDFLLPDIQQIVFRRSPVGKRKKGTINNEQDIQEEKNVM